MTMNTPKLKPFWRQRRYVLPLALGVLLNGLAYVALTYRLATKQERLARQHETLTGEIAERRDELKKLQGDRERVSRNQETADHFWTEVAQPLEPGLTEAIAELDRLASEAGLNSDRMSFTYDFLDVGLTEVSAAMPLEGSYFNLVRFINSLERSPRFFVVKEIGLNRSQDEERQIGLTCDVSFFLKGNIEETQRDGGP
jgi:Tfp pilus assembly protein PilO